MVDVLHEIPEGLLTAKLTELHQKLKDLTLIHLPGDLKPALFISCLVHGNEITGWLVIQELLKKYQNQKLPRDLILLFGNLTAAKEGLRRLEGQPDYNRIWKGGHLPQNQRAMAILDYCRKTGVFASIDIHNNTGRNPIYSCIVQFDKTSLNLAKLFGNLSLYFEDSMPALTSGFSKMGPAIALEAGQPGQPEGIRQALTFVEKILSLGEIPDNQINSEELNVMQIEATIKIPASCSVGFLHEPEPADVKLPKDFDLNNFLVMPKGSLFCHVVEDVCRLEVIDNSGHDVFDDYFVLSEGKIKTKVDLTPAMITLDKQVLKLDCVGYVMKRKQIL